MSSNADYIRFDRYGIIGPILTLLYQPNDDEIESISKIIETNYFRSKGVGLKHRDEFCKVMHKCIQKTTLERLKKMMNTKFIKGMHQKSRYCCQPKSPFHNRIQSIAIPQIFKDAKKLIPTIEPNNPKKINEFVTFLFEGFLADWQIEDFCDFHEIANQNQTFAVKIEKIRGSLINEINNKNLNENDLNTIIKGISGEPLDYLADDPNGQLVKRVVKKYLAYSSLLSEKNAKKVTEIVSRALDRDYRSILFPAQRDTGDYKSESSSFL